MQIRRFLPSDLPPVLLLHRIAMEQVGAFLGDGPWDNDLRDIPNHYFNSGGEFLVGFDQNELVAMGAFRRIDSKTAEIKRMRTEPSKQGRGVGKQIYYALESRARVLNYERFILETSILQSAAQALYRGMGFVEFKREKIQHLECIWFEKTLSL